MRVALVVNKASGGGTDPAPLERAMRDHGAEVTTCGCEPDDLGTIPAAEPERVVVAGGDGTVGVVAELAGRLGVPLGVVPAGHRERLRAHERAPARPGRGRGARRLG